jgi:hypothetical protein
VHEGYGSGPLGASAWWANGSYVDRGFQPRNPPILFEV